MAHFSGSATKEATAIAVVEWFPYNHSWAIKLPPSLMAKLGNWGRRQKDYFGEGGALTKVYLN